MSTLNKMNLAEARDALAKGDCTAAQFTAVPEGV
jgi:hypothetical protein